MPLTLRSRDTNRAFERIYRAHVGDVYRYALAVTGNRADAEDVTQTTFMQAFRALERGEQPRKPRNWLITVAHNVCRQRFREGARQPVEVAYDDDVAEALVPSDEAPTAADIQRALGELALNQREALVMRELEGRSYAEIAETMGLSVSAVETLIFRARRALREQLEGALTCSEAEAALSLQLDGQLSRAEAGRLRGHLRACESCRRLARRQRAQRKAVRGLAAIPVPPGLAIPWLAGGSTAGVGVGIGVAAKVAAVTVAVAVAGSGTYAVVRHETAPHTQVPKRAAAPATVKLQTRSHGHAVRHRPATVPRSTHAAAAASVAAVAHPAHPSHPAHPPAPAHGARAKGAAKKPKKSFAKNPAAHTNGRACRTRPSKTLATVTTVNTLATPGCPTPLPHGHSK